MNGEGTREVSSISSQGGKLVPFPGPRDSLPDLTFDDDPAGISVISISKGKRRTRQGERGEQRKRRDELISSERGQKDENLDTDSVE